MAQYLHMQNDPRVEEDLDVLTDLSKKFSLVLFDDDVHTFDDVIHALIIVCEHDPIQAEQCTLIVHFKGKCTVKSGEYEKLETMCTALHDRGLTAEIQ